MMAFSVIVKSSQGSFEALICIVYGQRGHGDIGHCRPGPGTTQQAAARTVSFTAMTGSPGRGNAAMPRVEQGADQAQNSALIMLSFKLQG